MNRCLAEANAFDYISIVEEGIKIHQEGEI
jgi:hypothetical protein